eukprot:m.104289 g.104289  ORF g.104289 m.104289 type:complete len:87 (+) comp9109_c1_seq1:66-326(+)
MQNDQGQVVDLYLPRKCSATNSLIGAKDHASIQIEVAKIDENGLMIPRESHTYTFCGAVRSMGETDDTLNRLAQEDKILQNVYEKN